MTEMQKPLRVKVAEALGWKNIVRSHDGHLWVGDPPPHTLWYSRIVPPLGEDSPEGWACTGPLVSKYGITLTFSYIEQGMPIGHAAALDAALGRPQSHGSIVTGANRCEAIANLIIALAEKRKF